MTLREKIGQRFIVGFPGPEITEDFKAFLEEYKIGNIILFERNIENDSQLYRLCNELQELITKNTGHRAFITVDQEGGNIVRLTEDGVNVPGAMAVAATGQPENAYLAGRMTGRELHGLGINFDLAPVMDVNCNANNPVICERSYGDTPQQVARYGVQMMRGLLDENVLSCAKHFPGHGDTQTDSHLNLPVVEKSREELEQTELIPFRRIVEAGIPAVMSAHILYPGLEPERYPATMSKRILSGLLREEWGFEGLILSDCLEMGAVKEYYGVAQGCVKAMEAGVDMVFVSHTDYLAKAAIEALEEKVKTEPEFEENIDRALERILKVKAAYIEESRPEGIYAREKDRQAAYELLAQTIVPVNLPEGKLPQLGENPLFIGCPPFDATGVENPDIGAGCFAEMMQEAFGGHGISLDPDAGSEETGRIVEQAKGCSSVVMSVFHGDQKRVQLTLAHRLGALDIPVIVISLKSPYELAGLPHNVTALAAWEYSDRCVRLLQEILSGRRKINGAMPVKIR